MLRFRNSGTARTKRRPDLVTVGLNWRREQLEFAKPLDDAIVDEGGLTAPHVPMADAEATRILQRLYGIDGAVTRLATEKDDTFRVDTSTGPHSVLKISNPHEKIAEIDFQIKLVQHVAHTDPTIPVPAFIPDKDGQVLSTVVDDAGQQRKVRLISHLEGVTLDRLETSSAERAKVGEVLAKLRHATASFTHPQDSRVLAWDVKHVLGLSPLLEHVDDLHRREQVKIALERMAGLQPRVHRLREQVLHNDFSKSNLLGDHGRPEFVTGVIDFGDAVRTAVAIDVSTALLNQLPRDAATNPVDDLFSHARDVVHGYLRYADLSDQELTLIPHLVMARVVARALITTWRAKLFPHNTTYIMRNTEQGWAQLDWFLNRSVDQISTTLISDRRLNRN
jgi:hydroxylysine kinase